VQEGDRSKLQKQKRIRAVVQAADSIGFAATIIDKKDKSGGK